MAEPAATGAPAAYGHLTDDLGAVLDRWPAPDPAQEALRTAYLTHLGAHPDAVLRAGPPEHFTASCLVLDAGLTAVLLTHHRKANAWFQFGGHLEPADVSVHAAAVREATEESGLAALDLPPVVVQLDRHELSAAFGRCRAHLDVRYAAVADRSAAYAVSAESLDVAWFAADDPMVRGLRPLIDAARRSLG